MAIKYLSKKKAKLIVSVGSASKGTRKQYTKTVEISGKKDAERQFRDFENECKSITMIGESVSDLLDSYVNMQRIKGIKATTLQGYGSCVKRLKSRFNGIKAKDLTPYQIESFIASALEGDAKNGYPKKVSPKTIKNYVSLLNSAYKMAVRSKLLTYNPCSAVNIPKQKRKEKIILKKDEIKKFVNALDDTTLDLRVVYELALFCGLRRSEIMGLRNSDINTTWSAISVVRTRHRIKGEDVIQDTKTTGSRRIASCPAFVMDDIIELMREHEEDPYIENDFLIQYAAEPMRPDYAKRQIKRFTAEHGLPDVTLHGLRHTFASMLNNSGQFDIAEISASLGHSNISTTLNIYTHLFEEASHSSKRIADFMQKGDFWASSENEKSPETLKFQGS